MLMEDTPEEEKAIQIRYFQKIMEEMANAPREEIPYKRQPGEKGAYETFVRNKWMLSNELGTI